MINNENILRAGPLVPSQNSIQSTTRIALYAILLLLPAYLVAPVLGQTNYTPYTFTAFAGLAVTWGNADGMGSAARFNMPSGIAVDSARNIYVADRNDDNRSNDTIRRITPDGVVCTLAKEFFEPRGIAVDSSNNVFVADTKNHTIRQIKPDGDVSTLAGLNLVSGYADGIGSGARFSSPTGVAVDSAGDVLVVDGSRTIRRIKRDGTVSTIAGSAISGAGANDGPANVARFGSLRAIAVDGLGNIFVADHGFFASFTIRAGSSIRKITPDGIVTTVAGGGKFGFADGTGSAVGFSRPGGVAVDNAGNVYVADGGIDRERGNNTVRKITFNGVVTTLGGTPNRFGFDDGTGSAARFANPSGVAVDSAGNLYVADAWSGAIRKGWSSLGDGAVTIISQPQSQAAAEGNDVTFRVVATGPPPQTYLWRKNGINITDATNQTYTIRKVQFIHSGLYSVAISNSGGLTVSYPASLTVTNAWTALNMMPPYTFTTLAGVSSSGSADGVGRAARFSSPAGMAVDKAGNVYVTDTGNHTIRKITSDGMVTTFAGLAESRGHEDGIGSAARFWDPSGLALDDTGNLYVGGGRGMRKITPEGLVSTLADANSDRAMAVDKSGNRYVAGGSGIDKITPSGVVIPLASFSQLSGPFFFHTTLAVDSMANVYVASPYITIIQKITPDGVVSTLAGVVGRSGSVDGARDEARFRRPMGLAVDGAGNVYVADSSFSDDKYGNHTIRKITPDGVVTTLAGAPGSFGGADGVGNTARFNRPTGLATDTAGNVYVADTDNHAIRKITPDGEVSTMAGLVGSGGADGMGSAAQFNTPTGVAVDSIGNAYVADTGNSAIRKITREGLGRVNK